MLRKPSIRTQIDDFTAQGNKLLAEASQSGDRSVYLKAIQEFALSYKYALLLNSGDGTEQVCAFNFGVAHIAGGDVSRGITLLKTILDHGGWPEDEEKPSKDTYRGDVYYNLAGGYEKVSEPENAMKCYMHALLQYNHEDDARKVAETYLKIANLFNAQKDFSEARRNFDLASKVYMKLHEKGNVIIAQTCQVNAGILDRTFSREECVRLLNNCCNLCGELDSKGLQGKVLCEVGLLYYKLGRLERALLCFEKSVNLCEVAHIRRKAVAFQNAGAILNTLGYYEEAIPRHIESARLHGILTNRNAQGQSFCNVAFAYSQLGFYEDSWEAYLHALKAFEDTGDRQGQWQCHEGLGAIAYNGGRMKRAVEHFNKALACQTETISDGSRQRVLNKLTSALKFGQQETKNAERPLEIDRIRFTESSDDDIVDSKPTTSKPRRMSKRRRMKSLDRGRRRYADESDRPIRHIARGISNLTHYTNPYAEGQTYIPESGSESDVPDFLSDVNVAHRPLSSMDGSVIEEKKKRRVFHKEPAKRKKIQGLVQVATMPINALTVAQDNAGPSAQELDIKETVPHKTDGFSEKSPRGDVSSSQENMAKHYREQLTKIDEADSEEESYTSVTDTSSSSSSDDEPDGSPERSMRDPTYENNHLANAPSLAAPSSGLDNTHLYATLNTAKKDDTTVPKKMSPQDSNATYQQIPLRIEDRNSGEEIPSLLSAHSPRSAEELERSSHTSEEDSEAHSEPPAVSYTPPVPSPPPPRKKKKKPKEKNDESRSCMIM